MKSISMKRNAVRVVFVVLASLLFCIIVLFIWTCMSEKYAHISPAVERVSIDYIVEKKDWTAVESQVLTEQTGLSREALEYLREQGRQQELMALQEAYFCQPTIDCQPNSIISKEEHVVDPEGKRTVGMPIPYIEEGDILITNCSHVLGWRNGHAALVVDAERRLVLEAQVLGSPSIVAGLNYWETYPSFVVLRLKGAAREERAAIAAFAEANLVGVPYVITAGILERLLAKTAGREQPSGTHCSHLIWYAFREFGYDLDSDGGLVVTPRDIAESEKLKVIQNYGVGSMQ